MKARLSHGMLISHLDSGTNGVDCNVARVLRARGLGVLVQRGIFKYRIHRDDVIRIIPQQATLAQPPNE